MKKRSIHKRALLFLMLNQITGPHRWFAASETEAETASWAHRWLPLTSGSQLDVKIAAGAQSQLNFRCGRRALIKAKKAPPLSHKAGRMQRRVEHRRVFYTLNISIGSVHGVWAWWPWSTQRRKSQFMSASNPHRAINHPAYWWCTTGGRRNWDKHAHLSRLCKMHLNRPAC